MLQITYKDGKKHGPWAFYNNDGQLMGKGNYKDGKREGPSVEYYDNARNGQLVNKGNYKDDQSTNLFEGSDRLDMFMFKSQLK